MTEWQTKMWMDGCRPQVNVSVQNRSKTMAEWGENRRCLSLSACHLAVSLSRICYHASYERVKEDIQGYLLIQKSGPFAVFAMNKWLLSVSTWGLKYSQHVLGPGLDTYHGILVNISWILCIHPKLMLVPRWLQLIHQEVQNLQIRQLKPRPPRMSLMTAAILTWIMAWTGRGRKERRWWQMAFRVGRRNYIPFLPSFVSSLGSFNFGS